jgi:hypothetical protein
LGTQEISTERARSKEAESKALCSAVGVLASARTPQRGAINQKFSILRVVINQTFIMEQSGLPLYSGPVDTLRQGLSSLESQHATRHPIHSVQSSRNNTAWALKLDTVRRMYGSHMAMTLATEKEIFSRMRRLPGLETSNVGLETVMGVDESIDFPDFLNGGL